jgi:hypothetical protein
VLLFIENLAGLHIASYSSDLASGRHVKFVSRSVLAYVPAALRRRGVVIPLSSRVMRIVKPLLSLLQLPVVQQDPIGLAFRLSRSRHVLSDGLLTEYLVNELGVEVGRFYSLASVSDVHADVVPGCAIVGSNWLEFGSMSEASYTSHLRFLHRQYPQAIYFCHPKETNRVPEQVFGAAQVRRPALPLEALLRQQGVPARLVGVCSSSLLALGTALGDRFEVDLVEVHPTHFDGWRTDTVEQLKTPIKGKTRLSVHDVQKFLEQQLQARQVAVRWIRQPVA